MLYLRDVALARKSWGLVLRNMIVAAMLVVFGMLSKQPNLPKTVAYKFVRQLVRLQTDLKTRHWAQIAGENFYVRHQAADTASAKMVLDAAEASFKPVNRMLGAEPEGAIPIVLYPDKESLNKSFGWDADQNAMGVYWAGVIRILSPLAWVEGDTFQRQQQYFWQNGPMAHEYTHMAVDYKTGGNYPRWLTEGIAQYVERGITGFQFRIPQLSGRSDLYPLRKMNGEFDLLPRQSVAYWQSLAMVELMVELQGMEGVRDLLDDLGQGQSFDRAFKKVYSMSPIEFELEFASTMGTL